MGIRQAAPILAAERLASAAEEKQRGRLLDAGGGIQLEGAASSAAGWEPITRRSLENGRFLMTR